VRVPKEAGAGYAKITLSVPGREDIQPGTIYGLIVGDAVDAEAVRAFGPLADERSVSTQAPKDGGAAVSPIGLVKLDGGRPLPKYLARSPSLIPYQRGRRTWGRLYAKTTEGSYLNDDFTYEVVLEFAARQEHIAFVGLGEGGNQPPYDEPSGSAFLRIHRVGLADGKVVLTNGVEGSGETIIGHINKRGEHLIRITKKGSAVTFAVDVGNDGNSPEDFSKTIPGIRQYQSALDSKNTHLFFGGSGFYKAIRVVRGSKSAEKIGRAARRKSG
jgi:hypothetical protein